MTELRTCTKCAVPQGAAEFYIDKRRNQPFTVCRTCWKRRTQAWKARNPENYLTINRRSARKNNPKRYGLTADQYDAMVLEQQGLCALCEKPEIKKNYGTTCKLSVDHDHRTGRVRGLLCSKCNSILGMANDNIALLMKAILYLKRQRWTD